MNDARKRRSRSRSPHERFQSKRSRHTEREPWRSDGRSSRQEGHYGPRGVEEDRGYDRGEPAYAGYGRQAPDHRRDDRARREDVRRDRDRDYRRDRDRDRDSGRDRRRDPDRYRDREGDRQRDSDRDGARVRGRDRRDDRDRDRASARPQEDSRLPAQAGSDSAGDEDVLDVDPESLLAEVLGDDTVAEGDAEKQREERRRQRQQRFRSLRAQEDPSPVRSKETDKGSASDAVDPTRSDQPFYGPVVAADERNGAMKEPSAAPAPATAGAPAAPVAGPTPEAAGAPAPAPETIAFGPAESDDDDDTLETAGGDDGPGSQLDSAAAEDPRLAALRERVRASASNVNSELRERQSQLQAFLISLRRGREAAGMEEGDDDAEADGEEETADDGEVAQRALAVFGEEDDEARGRPEAEASLAPKAAVFDMFAEEDVGPLPSAALLAGAHGIDRGEGGGLEDNWDDAEGYYTFRVNEVLQSRYRVISALGRGVFSSVLRAYDMAEGNRVVAVKVIRAHDIMYQAGQKELALLRELTDGDPDNRKHCIRILDHFEYRQHLCIVMEAMHLNLRKLVKKYGKGEGISLRAVKSYARQLFVALRHVDRAGLVHADLKPDNMVVNEGLNVLKVCDFGSAYRRHELPELDGTPYVVSRYYRAPEVVLGYGPKSAALDVWAGAVSLAEMFTGKLLFTGRDNNTLLRSIMEICGKVPRRLLSRSNFRDQHFDERGAFLAGEIDRVTGAEVVRPLSNWGGERDLLQELSASVKPQAAERLKADLGLFKDLLEKCLNLDPGRRFTADQALQHSFLKEST